MSQSENSVFVIYRQDNFELEEISRIPEMMPNRASVGGEKENNTVWKLFAPDNTLDLAEQLKSWVNLLECKADKLLKIKGSGWAVDLLRQLSSLHVNLIIRVWE